MSLSQKCQYGVRALFELGKRTGDSPASVAEIANAQAIPPRFLEAILQQLREAGFVRSRRGTQGGYVLAVAAESITVTDVIRAIDGSVSPVKCIDQVGGHHCELKGQCVFARLWTRARDSLAGVYNTTLRDLINQEQSAANELCDYSI
jgi:Rrf2 family transcriptional regulator, cysteine metabolism repressor